MARKSVFYSFHFDNDVFRVQQVRNMGMIDENTPVKANEWEEVKRGKDPAIMRWIDENMKWRDCVVVLIGSETANRPWVQYEIKKAWNDERGLLGIHIHNLKCLKNGTCVQGRNPFEQFRLDNGTLLSSVVPCYNPSAWYTYTEIQQNMAPWVDHAIALRKRTSAKIPSARTSILGALGGLQPQPSPYMGLLEGLMSKPAPTPMPNTAYQIYLAELLRKKKL